MTGADHEIKAVPPKPVDSTHHTFHPLCVCGFGLLHPVAFRAGLLPVPQPLLLPLPPAPHAPPPDAALLPHPPADGDVPAPEPEPPPHAVPPPPAGDVPQPPAAAAAPPPPPAPLPPGVPAVPPHPEGLASCPHPAALGATCAGNVPLGGGS
jgi:hypothetical protein